MSLRSSLRITIVLAALPLALLVARGLSGQNAPGEAGLTLLTKDGRRTLPLSVVGNQEFVALDDLAQVFALTVREESPGTITVTLKGRTIILTPNQALASVSGRLVSLPAPPARSGRRWLVPVDFIGRALALVSDLKLDLRKQSHLLVVGDLRVPRVAVRYEVAGAGARLTIEATPKTATTVLRQPGQLVIRFEADAIDATLPPVPASAQPPLVQAVRQTDAAVLTVDLGPRFSGLRTAETPGDTSSRLTLDFSAAATEGAAPAAGPTAPAAPTAPLPPPAAATGVPAASLRTVVIDPGHGGADAGARGGRGTKEKDVTLSVARRLKSAIEARLGIRVVLTRDDDRALPVDDRAAIANNTRADLFLSLHASASVRPGTSGASVWHAEFADALRAGAAAGSRTERLPVAGGGQREIDFVYWDLAQARQVDRSVAFAKIVAQHLNGRVPLAAHPLEGGPLRVLQSANMPAVLIEMGYLSNAGQESQLGGDVQGTVAQALFDAIVKYRDGLDQARRPVEP